MKAKRLDRLQLDPSEHGFGIDLAYEERAVRGRNLIITLYNSHAEVSRYIDLYEIELLRDWCNEALGPLGRAHTELTP